MKHIVLSSIRLYQRLSSGSTAILRFLFPYQSRCRFYPTCSTYTYEAVSSYGIIKGLLLGGHRILRCHPWSPGGNDPVPQKPVKTT